MAKVREAETEGATRDDAVARATVLDALTESAATRRWVAVQAAG